MNKSGFQGPCVQRGLGWHSAGEDPGPSACSATSGASVSSSMKWASGHCGVEVSEELPGLTLRPPRLGSVDLPNDVTSGALWPAPGFAASIPSAPGPYFSPSWALLVLPSQRLRPLLQEAFPATPSCRLI